MRIVKRRLTHKDSEYYTPLVEKKEHFRWIGPGESFRNILELYRRNLVERGYDLPPDVVRKGIDQRTYVLALSLCWRRILKRTIDIIIASILLILMAPLFLFIAVLIKLDSTGPIFFTQQRIGQNKRRHDRRETESFGNKTTFIFNRRTGDRRVHDLKGKPFKIYKFRTMKMGSPKYDFSPKNQEDERLTNFGGILRKVSLDELPQLLNVLNGDMSLVGPRPEMPYIVVGYNRLHEIRLQMKPGITGIWQLSASRDKPIHENLNYDLEYIRNWSLWLDMKLLFQTVVWMFHCINI
jgi:lipopolysaccharide/colanic/teichoic acid biosynthesis glycosyltransferase